MGLVRVIRDSLTSSSQFSVLTSHVTPHPFWILLPRHRLSALIGPSPPPPLWNPKFLPPLCFFHLPPQLGKGASKTTSCSQLASQSPEQQPLPHPPHASTGGPLQSVVCMRAALPSSSPPQDSPVLAMRRRQRFLLSVSQSVPPVFRDED